MQLFQFLLSVAVAGIAVTGSSTKENGMSESDILKTVFYGSEDALRGTLEDFEVGPEDDEEPIRRPWPGGQEYSRETRMNYICDNLAEAPSSDTVRTIQYKLGRIETPELRKNVMGSLNSKKAEMRVCCIKTGDERYNCMDEARRNRYNRVCEGEEPCPWALLKGRHPDVSLVTGKCCLFEGNARYRCFLKARLDQKCYRRPMRNQRV